MKVGIVGLPQSGKSTLFALLTEKHSDVKTYTLGKAEFHLGQTNVPDEKLEKLSQALKPPKTTPTKISFVDMAVRGASTLKGFDISHIRDVDALAEVVGVFSGSDPIKDIEKFETELLLVDLEVIQTRLEKLVKEVKSGKKEAKLESDLLERAQKSLEEGTALRKISISAEEEKIVRGYKFLSIKPLLLVVNLSESQIKNPPTEKLKKLSEERKVKLIELSAKIELEISELDENERTEFMRELGITESARDRFIRNAYGALDLISFFTVVGDEMRVWSINRNTQAVEAAGCVHTDMQRGFIRAEVIAFEDFVNCGYSFQEAKKRGLLRLEGKEYIVQDADIVNFRFNV